jgi:hypothetical protein
MNNLKKIKDFITDSNRIYLYTIFLILIIYSNNMAKIKMKILFFTMIIHLFNWSMMKK